MGDAHKLLCNKNKGDNHGTEVAPFFGDRQKKARARGINNGCREGITVDYSHKIIMNFAVLTNNNKSFTKLY